MQVENQFSTSIKSLRSDGGGEFVNKKIYQTFLQQWNTTSANMSIFSISEQSSWMQT